MDRGKLGGQINLRDKFKNIMIWRANLEIHIISGAYIEKTQD